MILQKRYTKSYIEFLERRGKVVLRTDYRIDLADFYCRSGVKIDERIIVDPKTMIPWFAYFCYSDLPKEKRIRVFEAIEEIYRKTNGLIFRSSSDSGPTIRVNALLKYPDEEIIEEAKRYFLELENIIQND